MRKNRLNYFLGLCYVENNSIPRPGKVLCAFSSYGFTVIEVLVVIALIALIAGAGSALYKGTYEGLLVERAARDFYLAARYARMLAVERQQPCIIEVDDENNQYAIVMSEYSEDTQEVEQRIIRDFYFKPVQLKGNVEFENVTITSAAQNTYSDEQNNTIVFMPDGTAQLAVIQIGDGKTHYTASISAATGKVKMHFGKAGDIEAQVIDLDSIGRY